MITLKYIIEGLGFILSSIVVFGFLSSKLWQLICKLFNIKENKVYTIVLENKIIEIKTFHNDIDKEKLIECIEKEKCKQYKDEQYIKVDDNTYIKITNKIK